MLVFMNFKLKRLHQELILAPNSVVFEKCWKEDSENRRRGGRKQLIKIDSKWDNINLLFLSFLDETWDNHDNDDDNDKGANILF